MLALHGSNDINLTSAGRKCADIFSAHAEQNDFGGIAEVKAYSSPIGTTVFTHFMPNEIAFVRKSPCLQYAQTLRQ